MPKLKEVKKEVKEEVKEEVVVKTKTAKPTFANNIDFTGKFEVVEIGDGKALVYNENGVRVSDPLSVNEATDIARQSNFQRGFK